MKFLPKYKVFEFVSLSYAKAKEREGFRVIGFQKARNMFTHIGKDVLFDNDSETGKLTAIAPIEKGKFVYYYGTIERVRDKKVFTSRRLITTLEKI